MTFDDVSVDRMREWQVSTTEFVRDNFRVEPDRWQRKVLDAFDDPAPKARISMQACVGPGKTTVEAWCGWKFLACFGDDVDKPKGLAVSVTGENLRDNLWAELAKWQAQSPFLSNCFTWTSTRIFANGYQPTWFLGARAWPKSGNSDEQGKTLSGLHSRYVLVLADESGAIPVPVMRAGEQALSSCVWGRILQGGNTISLEGMLYAAASTFRQLWTVIHVTGDPDDPDAYVNTPRAMAQHTGLPDCACSRCWATQQIAAYGRDNPWVQAYILGMFPKGTINTLLSLEEVEAAMQRTYKPDDYTWAQKRLGIDVARFGDDRTVVWPRQGLVNFRPVVMRHARTNAIAARAATGCQAWAEADGVPVEQVTVDNTGNFGAGVIDQLLAGGYPVIALQYHAPASDKRYANVRAEMWFAGAEAIRRGEALPPLPEMVSELTQPTYTFVNGKLQLEPKDMLKKRIGRSPDLADAWAQTHAYPDQPREALERLQQRHTALHDSDPLAELEHQVVGVGHAVHDAEAI